MKKSIIFTAILAFIALSLYSQDNHVVNNDSIIFEKLVHDYGTIKKGSDGSFDFSFTNKGKSPLVVTTVKSSCGCAAVEWPEEPVLPGEKGNVRVKYNTNLEGEFSKPVTVYSSAGNAVVVLRIKGNVIP